MIDATKTNVEFLCKSLNLGQVTLYLNSIYDSRKNLKKLFILAPASISNDRTPQKQVSFCYFGS